MARHFLYFRLPWAEAGTRRRNFGYVDSLYRRWAPGWKGPERDAALARAKEAFSTPEVLEASIDYYRALGSKIDRRLLGPIACSGLLVAGGQDFGGHLGPYKKSQGLLGGGAELLVMPGPTAKKSPSSRTHSCDSWAGSTKKSVSHLDKFG